MPPRKKSISSNKENSPEVLGRPTTIGAEADLDVSNFVHIESFLSEGNVPANWHRRFHFRFWNKKLGLAVNLINQQYPKFRTGLKSEYNIKFAVISF